MKQTLVFSCEMEKYGNILISIFQHFFPSISESFILGERMGARLQFYEVLRFSWPFLISEDPKSKVTQQLVRQLVHTMLVNNNRVSFHLW